MSQYAPPEDDDLDFRLDTGRVSLFAPFVFEVPLSIAGALIIKDSSTCVDTHAVPAPKDVYGRSRCGQRTHSHPQTTVGSPHARTVALSWQGTIPYTYMLRQYPEPRYPPLRYPPLHDTHAPRSTIVILNQAAPCSLAASRNFVPLVRVGRRNVDRGSTH